MGVNGAELRYRVADPAASHVFFTGTSTTTQQELLRIGGDKLVTTVAGGGLVFGNSTASYVPYALDYYETSTSLTFSMGGPWAASRNLVFTFTRIGRMVFVTWPDLSAQAVTVGSQIIQSGLLVGSQYIPTRFVPSVFAVIPVVVYNNSGSGATGDVAVSNGAYGKFFSFRAPNATNFTATAGIAAGCVCWYI